MIHEYECGLCGKTVEIDKPLAEQYVPSCCDKPMTKLYSTNISAGALNAKNLPK